MALQDITANPVSRNMMSTARYALQASIGFATVIAFVGPVGTVWRTESVESLSGKVVVKLTGPLMALEVVDSCKSLRTGRAAEPQRIAHLCGL